ncbi:MAG: ribosome maturation factor RimM, partial [Treponema sp.]|nr:ribosome maturation factor RimM [Treponema sp.]
GSPEEARGLGGAELLVGREDAAPLGPGEYYVEDLKGMIVFGESGEVLGKIISVIEGGGGDLAEVCLADGQKRMVPFRDEFFSGIDTENARAVLLNTWILE